MPIIIGTKFLLLIKEENGISKIEIKIKELCSIKQVMELFGENFKIGVLSDNSNKFLVYQRGYIDLKLNFFKFFKPDSFFVVRDTGLIRMLKPVVEGEVISNGEETTVKLEVKTTNHIYLLGYTVILGWLLLYSKDKIIFLFLLFLWLVNILNYYFKKKFILEFIKSKFIMLQ